MYLISVKEGISQKVPGILSSSWLRCVIWKMLIVSLLYEWCRVLERLDQRTNDVGTIYKILRQNSVPKGNLSKLNNCLLLSNRPLLLTGWRRIFQVGQFFVLNGNINIAYQMACRVIIIFIYKSIAVICQYCKCYKWKHSKWLNEICITCYYYLKYVNWK